MSWKWVIAGAATLLGIGTAGVVIHEREKLRVGDVASVPVNSLRLVGGNLFPALPSGIVSSNIKIVVTSLDSVAKGQQFARGVLDASSFPGAKTSVVEFPVSEVVGFTRNGVEHKGGK